MGRSLLSGALEGVGDLADGEAVVVGVGDVDVAVEGDALAAHALEGDAVQRRLRLGDVRDLVRHELLGLVHQALLLLRLLVLARHGSFALALRISSWIVVVVVVAIGGTRRL